MAAFERGDLRRAKNEWSLTIFYAFEEKQKEGWAMTPMDFQIGSLAYLYRGLAYLKSGDNVNAFQDFIRAEQYSGDFPDIQVQIAAQYYKLDLIDETKRLCGNILQQHPNDGAAHYYLGYAEMKSGEKKKALDHAKKAKSLGYPYADFLIQTIEEPNKRAQMQDVKEVLPGEFIRVAVQKFQDGQYDDTIDICRKILNGNERQGLAHYYLGFSYYKKGQKDDAMKHAVRAKELGVTYADLLIENLKK